MCMSAPTCPQADRGLDHYIQRMNLINQIMMRITNLTQPVAACTLHIVVNATCIRSSMNRGKHTNRSWFHNIITQKWMHTSADGTDVCTDVP